MCIMGEGVHTGKIRGLIFAEDYQQIIRHSFMYAEVVQFFTLVL